MKSSNFLPLIKLLKLCVFDHQIELYLGIEKTCEASVLNSPY